MKIKVLCLLACLIHLNSTAKKSNSDSFPSYLRDTVKPSDSVKVEPPEQKVDSVVVTFWTEKNEVGVNLSEVAFVNWNAGGNNSISALVYTNLERNYKKDDLYWRNKVVTRFGINSQEGQKLRKTEDELRLTSSFGYRRDSTSNWFYSAKLNFNTQFTNGYKYPDTNSPISKFMAPGYFFLGIGTEYSDPIEDLKVYISPLTQKSTFVLDQRLANEGMFGVTGAVRDTLGNIVEEGEKVRTEIGFLVTSDFSKQIFENVELDSQLSLYSDYLNKFGNIDVEWQVRLDLKVNDFIKANVGAHLRYDDDVKFKEDTNGDGKLETTGPRVQFKQMLGVGLVYEF